MPINRKSIPPQRGTGFTLIELLIAMTLFGMLFSVLYGALRLGAKTSSAVKMATEQNHSDYSGRSLLRHSIENAMIFVAASNMEDFRGNPAFAVSFDGGPQRLRYVSEFTSPEGVMRPYVFEIEFDELRQAIVLHYSKDTPTRQAWSAQLAETEVLVENISGFSIDYLTYDKRAGRSWVTEWRRMPRMPDLVRIVVDARNRVWPDLVIQPRNFLDMRQIDDIL
jgi:general secretion pathway protein J